MKNRITITAFLLLAALITYQAIPKSSEMPRTDSSEKYFSQNKNSFFQILRSNSAADLPITPIAESSSLPPNKTVEDLMNEHNSDSEDEIRNRIRQISGYLDDQKLIAKSNSGQINEQEKKELVLIMRLNTALNRLLIERALETSRI